MWKRLTLLIVIGCTMMLSGCWDNLDIERNAFVMGAAIDLAEDDDNTFVLTNQVAIPAKLSSQEQSGGGGGDKPYVNMTAKGDSIMSMVRETAQRSSRVPSFDHMKVLVISDKIAQKQDLFTSVMDLLIRDMEMRRNIKVLISGGKTDKAKNMLEIDSPIEQVPSSYIDEVTKNADLTLRMPRPALIGDVQGDVLQEFSYILPQIHKPAKAHLKYNGAVVFNGQKNKMVGMLAPNELFGLNLMTRQNKNSILKFKVEGYQMAYELDYGDAQITINTNNPEHMDINIDIKTQGRIAEMFGGKSLLQKDYMQRIEHKITNKIESVAKDTIDKLQNDLNTDVLGIGKKLSRKHPDIWDKIQDDWEKGEGYFSNANIHVKAIAELQHIGASDKTKDKREGE